MVFGVSRPKRLSVVDVEELGKARQELGFAKVRIAPHPAGLKNVSANIPTIRGTVCIVIDGNDLSVDSPAPAEIEWKGTQRICKITETLGGGYGVKPLDLSSPRYETMQVLDTGG